MRTIAKFLAAVLLILAKSVDAGLSVTATKTTLLFRIDGMTNACGIVELAPYENALDAAAKTPLVANSVARKVVLPRFDGARDRIYSGFVLTENGSPVGPVRYVEIREDISRHRAPYPRTKSKKGLQVQMVDDAVKLGVQHAAFNIDIGACVRLTPTSDDLPWNLDGRTFWFSSGYIHGIDAEVKTMSDAGATVTLILLNYSHPGLPANAILQHPYYDPACPGHISEFNTQQPEALEWFKAWTEFLADRYSSPGYAHGRVVNYIVGNEVNAHWDWANMGNVTMDQFAPDYQRAVRLCAMAVRKESSSGRVFISLEHDWGKLFAETNELHGFPARDFLLRFNELAKAGGDFDWNLAFHPYPEDLFNCRTWEDKTALPYLDSPRITFKNIEMLARFFQQKEMTYRGQPRHIILSEQGFHSKPTAKGELDQAAAYCYAWRKIVHLKGIDAFILHRHVDNGGEGGLNLGLWRRNPKTVSEPSSKKPIYEVFRQADTSHWKEAFQFALPIIGIESWSEIDSH